MTYYSSSYTTSSYCYPSYSSYSYDPYYSSTSSYTKYDYGSYCYSYTSYPTYDYRDPYCSTTYYKDPYYCSPYEPAPNNPPYFTNVSDCDTICIDENTTFVIDIDAYDKDGDALTYSIAGGDDAALFQIDPATGKLSFIEAPDFEDPTDVGGDNVYEVAVKVSDGNGGEAVKLLSVCIEDVAEGCTDCIVIEAEDMYSCGFTTVSGAQASGGELVKLACGYTGSLKTLFKGCDGTYDIKLFAQDENDGQSKIVVKVNGVEVKTIILDGDSDGGGDNNGSFSEFVIEGVDLSYGDKIAIYAVGDAGEFVRIDKLEICQDVEPELGSIGDTVWFDANGDGIQDASEAGIANVTVNLLDASGTIIATQATDGNGNYLFDNLPAGDYKVAFELPAGALAFTMQDAGADDAADSDADIATGMTDTITLAEGEHNLTVDAGIVELPGSISGRYFCDTNDNDQDDGNGSEPGVAGVVVELLDASGVPTGITTVTDADGYYSFTGLDAGTYGVQFTDPDGVLAGKQLVTPNVGDDASDSDAIGDTTLSTISGIVVTAGEDTPDNDAGAEYILGSLSGRYFEDLNGDGLDNDGAANGVPGVVVELLDETGTPTGESTLTDADGNYSFTDLMPGTYGVKFTDAVTGKVLTTQNVDGDASDDIDSDATDLGGGMSEITGIVVVGGADTPDNDAGVVDPGTASLEGRLFMDSDGDNLDVGEAEMGVPDVTVELLNGAGVVIATTTTAGDGSYIFTGLDAGDYSVRFPTEVDGKVLVTQDVGADDTIDSDADTGTGETGTYTLAIGDHVTDVDAGIKDPGTASLGDTVFLDANENGVQDGGEAGVDGVTVTLYMADGTTPLASTTTSGGGKYAFTGLMAGSYVVGFDLPSGYVFTSQDVGDDAFDSDADTVSGLTGIIDLSIGENDLTIDAGLIVDEDPTANPDSGATCASEPLSLDVLADDVDPDGAGLTITSIDGTAISAGGTVVLASGAAVTLEADGTISYDASTGTYGGVAALDLLVGESAEEWFTYSIVDSTGGTSTTDVVVTICGEKNTLTTIESSLPSGGVFVETLDSAPGGDLFTITIEGTGDARFDGMSFDMSYCIDIFEGVTSGTSIPFNMYLADEGSVPTGVVSHPENLDLINWILNQDFGSMDNGDGTATTYTEAEIQGAIWGLTDDFIYVNEAGGYGTEANAAEIIAAAEAAGEGFVPEEGDVVGLVLSPVDTSVQPFIIGIDWDGLTLPCDCTDPYGL